MVLVRSRTVLTCSVSATEPRQKWTELCQHGTPHSGSPFLARFSWGVVYVTLLIHLQMSAVRYANSTACMAAMVCWDISCVEQHSGSIVGALAHKALPRRATCSCLPAIAMQYCNNWARVWQNCSKLTSDSSTGMVHARVVALFTTNPCQHSSLAQHGPTQCCSASTALINTPPVGVAIVPSLIKCAPKLLENMALLL